MTQITASNTIQYSNDSQQFSGSTSMIKLKELSMTDNYTGSWRIVFDLYGDPTYPTHGQIYKNGVIYGTYQTQNLAQYSTFSQDFTSISISSSDKIQLYADATNASYLVFVQNFRIEFTLPLTFNAQFIGGD